jgi:hypothetical protein
MEIIAADDRETSVGRSVYRKESVLSAARACCTLSAKFVTIISRGTEKIFVVYRFYQFVIAHNIIL